MNRTHAYRCAVPLLLAAFSLCFAATSAPAAADQPPRVFLHDAEQLMQMRQAIQQDDPAHRAVAEELRRLADSALRQEPVSVTDKQETPPSGDKRDYMSQGRYWWPNPDTDDGLPYIRRDGESNPEIDDLDRPRLATLTRTVQRLALGYYLLDEPAYAEHAAMLLRTWFLDDDLGMNPHLEFGQRIPGRTEGRGIGIIDTRGLTTLVDALGLLEPADAWTADDHAGVQQWFADYLDWLLHSSHGEDERNTRNNHGTYYDVQVASFALFIDQPEIAREAIEQRGRQRLDDQIDADGRQPRELARAGGWSYALYNLQGWFDLATLADHVGIDLWHARTDQIAGLRQALDYLANYAGGQGEWTYESDGSTPSYGRSGFLLLLERAARIYDEPAYRELIGELRDPDLPLHTWLRMWQPGL